MLNAAQLNTQLAELEATRVAFNNVIAPACNARAAALAKLPYSSEATLGILAFNGIIASIRAEGDRLVKAINDTRAQLPPKADVINAGSPIALQAGRGAISGAGTRKAR